MGLKFKLTSVFLAMNLAVIVLSLGFSTLMNKVNWPNQETTLFTISFTLVILAMAGFASFFYTRGIIKPIVAVTHALRDIAEGEGDLTRRIINHSKDEVGDLSYYFNLSMSKIENIVDKIQNETAALSRISSNLACNMNHTAAAMSEIAANIQSIRGRVISQSVSVSEASWR